jgi:hypothetical protein
VARGTPCSRNAHGEAVLAWDKSASRRARGWAGENVARSRAPSGHPTEMISLPAAEEERKEMNGVVGMTSWAQLKSPRPPRYYYGPWSSWESGALLSIDE